MTCAVGYAVKRRCNARLVAYIDDMGAATGKILAKADIEFKQVCSTVTDLGLDLAVDKCEGPRQQMSWTGTYYDTVAMTMEVDKQKIWETLYLVKDSLFKNDCNLHDIEVLLGKLQHAIKFCPRGRRFLNRLLAMRRNMSETGRYEFTNGARLDLIWFVKFLEKFNGTALIRSQFCTYSDHLGRRLFDRGWFDMEKDRFLQLQMA